MQDLSHPYIFWRGRFRKYGLLILVLSLAATFRLTFIQYLPGGLFPDEAANGLDINSIFNGDIKPFYERGNGREALFFYLLAPAVAFFGRTPFAHHLVSALIGIAVVFLTFLLVRRWFGERAAFFAGFFAAVSSWHVTLSRTAFRANTVPLFTLLFLYFSTRVIQAKNRRDYWLSSIIAGLSFGLGFYTYIPYRMMLPMIFFTLLALIIYDYKGEPRWDYVKRYWRAFLAVFAGFGVGISWLVWYFIKNPEWLAGRSGQVSIFSPDLNHGDILGTFFDVLGKTALSFFYEGDFNWRHNVSGFPFLSFFVAPLFVAGLLLVTVQSIIFVVRLFEKNITSVERAINIKRLPMFATALWFYLMIVPEVLTAEGIPHGLRLIGVIPAVFVIPAIFIEEVLTESRFQKRKTLTKFLVNSLFVLLLAGEFVYGTALYFGIAKNSPDYAYAFRSDLTRVSQYLNERNKPDATYLVIDLFSEQTPQYLTTQTNQPYQIIDPASLWMDPGMIRTGRGDDRGLRLKTGDQIIFSQSTQYDIEAFVKHFPRAEMVRKERNRFGQVIMTVYQQP